MAIEALRDIARSGTSAFAAGGGATTSSVVLSATQANSTVTPAVVTGMTFTVAPGQTLALDAILIFQSAATTTGGGIGIRVTQGAGADGPARGAAVVRAAINANAATENSQGGNYNVAAGANTLIENVGASVNALATNYYMRADAIVKNTSTNANTTVTVEFRSEVASSAVTLQIGSIAAATIF